MPSPSRIHCWELPPECGLDESQDRLVPSWAAVRDLLTELLADTWHNEAGVLADVDPECLHHYRVNLRRARALVSQTGSVIGKRTADRLADQLRAIARATGPLRDLDVQLANRAWYESLVPDHDVPQLAGFMADLEDRRRRALRALRRYLRSQAHRRHREHLAELLAGIAARKRPEPLARLFAGCVRRRFRRLAKHVRQLGDQPTDASLHRLRIDAKKLRYPFESARGIFSPEWIANWVPELKRVQDALGAAHDLVVCLGWVNGYIAAVAASAEPEPTAALELLAAALRDQLTVARETARQQVGDFVAQHSDEELRIGGKRKP